MSMSATLQRPAGEVIQSELSRFTAQCPRALLNNPPAFGTIVRVLPQGANPITADRTNAPTVDDPFADRPVLSSCLPDSTPDETLYAVVYAASTGSSEPGRRPMAYGLEEDRLRHEQPHIFELLATEFSALTIGCAHSGRFRAGLPARPPRLHAPVYECSDQEICAATENGELLRLLVNAPREIPSDELIVACLRAAYQCRGEDYPYLVRAGKQLASLLRGNPDRLNALLCRLDE
jgi:hypothetical protein